MRFAFATLFLAVSAIAEEAAEVRELGHKKYGGYGQQQISYVQHGKTTPLQNTKNVPVTQGIYPLPVFGKGPIPAPPTKGLPAQTRWLGKKKGGYNYGAGYGTHYSPPPTPVFPIPQHSKKAEPALPAVIKTVVPQPPVQVGKGKKAISVAQSPKVTFAPAPIPAHKKGGNHLPLKFRGLGKKKRGGYAAPVKKAAPAPTKKATAAWGVPTHDKHLHLPTKAESHSRGAYPAQYV